jgi:hypothetical protein
MLLLQQAQSGITVPLQNVLSQAGLMALQQQQQQQPGSTIAEQQQGGEGGNEPDSARMGQSGMMAVLAAKQRQQAQQGPQMLAGVRPAAGGYIQLPNGQLVPAAAGQLVPVPGGGLAMLQANPAGVPQPPVVDPLAVANALFTAGGNPHTIVWYIRTDGAAGGEGQQGGSIQGPYDPQVRLVLSVLCAPCLKKPLDHEITDTGHLMLISRLCETGAAKFGAWAGHSCSAECRGGLARQDAADMC